MRILNALLIATILIVGLGFYRGWIVLSHLDPEAGSEAVSINLATDPAKMKQDAKIVTDKAAELTAGVSAGVEPEDQENDSVQ